MALFAVIHRVSARVLLPGLLTACAIGGEPAGARADAPSQWPARVRAVYKVGFNGFDIGTFEFNSSVSGSSYTLTGDARLSALLGAFTWQGATRSAGTIPASNPKPAGYTFEFAGTGKSGSIKMGFQGDTVTNVAHVPSVPVEPAAVPVRDEHLKGVLDPLSAVMSLSRSASSNPCGRRIPVFDGRQRFDLVLSYHRQEHVSEARPSGQPGVAFVCRVRYVPIAGHRMTEETRGLAASDGIEISFRPVPSANLFVPHRITIPTMAGPATLTSQRVEIITSHNEQIALSY